MKVEVFVGVGKPKSYDLCLSSFVHALFLLHCGIVQERHMHHYGV